MPDFATYADYFIAGEGQFRILLAALVVLAGLSAVGRLIAGRDGFAEANLFGGWAMAVLLMTAGSVFLRLPFSYVFWPFAAVAAAALVWLLIKERGVGPAGFWRVLLIAVPLLLIASARMASEWDEFSHWLPTSRYIFEEQGFPFGGREVSGGHFPGYPYTWLLLIYMVEMTAGMLVEGAGAALNVLLLLLFGVSAVRLCFEAAGRPMPARATLGWGAAILAAAAATVLNPTFVQKVIMTNYADASTSTAVGIGTVLMFYFLGSLAAGDREKAKTLALQIGLTMAVLINIKQSNLVLVVMLVGSGGFVSLIDREIRVMDYVRRLPVLLIPAVLIYGVWRYHVIAHLPVEAEAMFMPYESWNTHVLWPILKQMLLVATKKGGYFGLMAIAVFFGVRALFGCKSGIDRLGLMVGIAFLGYNAFLYLIFVTQFGEYDALRVASYWRYNHHLGLMAVAFGAYGAGALWRRYFAEVSLPRALLLLPAAVMLVAPFAFAEKLRFDLEHPKPFYRKIGAMLPDLLPEGSRMLILDPEGTGESAVLTRYPLWHRRGELIGYAAAFHDVSEEALRKSVSTSKPDHILVHSVTPALNAALGMTLEESGHAYLLKRSADGYGWTIFKDWPRSDEHWAGR